MNNTDTEQTVYKKTNSVRSKRTISNGMSIYGASHLHSAYSYDAKLSLVELRDLFKSEGLSFALMTEHTDELDRKEAEAFIEECRHLSDDSFVFVPGFEVPYKDTHVLMIGANTFFEEVEAEALYKFKEHSALAVLAHPHKHGYSIDETLFKVIDGMEIWNSQYDGKYVPRNRSLKLFRKLKDGHSLRPFAGWDLHRVEHADGPRLSISVHKISEGDILNALISGDFKIIGRASSLDSSGSYVQGGGVFSYLLGAFSIFLVSSGKKVNKFLAYAHIRPPAKLRKFIRRGL